MVASLSCRLHVVCCKLEKVAIRMQRSFRLLVTRGCLLVLYASVKAVCIGGKLMQRGKFLHLSEPTGYVAEIIFCYVVALRHYFIYKIRRHNEVTEFVLYFQLILMYVIIMQGLGSQIHFESGRNTLDVPKLSASKCGRNSNS